MLPLESVPNVSEGRDAAVVAAIGAAYAAGGARLLDTHTDVDHNRSVHTLLAGGAATTPDSWTRSSPGSPSARELVDLRRHEGIHPRIGVADVVPLVPLVPEDMPRARQAALALGRRVGDELGLPVFLYGGGRWRAPPRLLPSRWARRAAGAPRRR